MAILVVSVVFAVVIVGSLVTINPRNPLVRHRGE